jgi:glutamate-1-semialdehyde aminotransferase
MCEPDASAQRRFYGMVRARGVHIGTNRIQFLSTAHGMTEIGQVADVLCDCLTKFHQDMGGV